MTETSEALVHHHGATGASDSGRLMTFRKRENHDFMLLSHPSIFAMGKIDDFVFTNVGEDATNANTCLL